MMFVGLIDEVCEKFIGDGVLLDYVEVVIIYFLLVVLRFVDWSSLFCCWESIG